ncbi:ATPase [Paraburkholderia sp. CNPSo 3272]|uniref:ATPase n=1 Tax=Paraburkholderia sp. CNPSo 3272 TaxID=2940931 RepID=UPI0020B71A5A|nr:ATPase [Paraburkholderia sp. CNPSo 3272]MCP3724622.1 ATPase [Paraburkholderia sp. CNPSo 3272]
MSTNNEDAVLVEAAASGTGIPLATTSEAENSRSDGTAVVGAPGVTAATDGADDGELETELQQMESDAATLQREGMISDAEADDKRQQVERTRRFFRDLPPAERAVIVRRRREIGRQLLERQLSGAAIVPAAVRLNHTRLRPLFEQWWPYLNRMSINMQRFGDATFGERDKGSVNAWFEKQVEAIEAYVDEQLQVADGFRERTEREMTLRGDIVFRPAVTKPSLEIEVEAFSRFAMRLLSVITRFDKVMDQFDFLVWNGVRDQSDVDEETARFLRKFHPVGVRGYMTHLRLMTSVRGL